MKLIIENVRCFQSKQVVPIKPLTLLVGENSTGKTTFLAAYRIAWDIAYGSGPIDFNEAPFQLGTYDQVANYRGGRAGRAKTFEIGFEFEEPNERKKTKDKAIDPLQIRCVFAKGETQPMVSEVSFGYRSLSSYFGRDPDNSDNFCIAIKKKGRLYRKESIPYYLYKNKGIHSIPLSTHFLSLFLPHRTEKKSGVLSEKDIAPLLAFLSRIRNKQSSRPRSIAPIRSKPERVYSQMEDSPVPSGSHTPMVLARAFEKSGKNYSDIQDILNFFGQNAGLFDKLAIKRFGNKKGDPFQIMVSNQSPPFNLIDVGYGVSQVLPILVDLLESPENASFLLQQPEVHLHPRAQAELGAFFTIILSLVKKTLIIETHSDYIIDRIRMGLRRKVAINNKINSLDPEDVVILFFEKNKSGAKIHPITIDEDGNIHGAPPGYRKFFMEEEKRYFGG